MPNRVEIDIKHSEDSSKEIASALYRYIFYTQRWREKGGFKNRNAMLFWEQQAIILLASPQEIKQNAYESKDVN